MSKTKMFLGDMEVEVEYDYEREERETWNGLTGVGDPGSPAAAIVNSVRIGDVWIDADNFSETWRTRCEEQILEAETEGQWEDQETRLAERGYP